jgi:hypothetical protein
VPGSESGGAVVRLPVVRPGVSSSVAVGGSRAYCRWQLGLPVMSGCAIEECERKHLARGWCHVHYSRWRKHGDPMKTLIRTKDDVQKRDANGNKLCWKCSQWQQESEFYLQSRFSDGLDKNCKTCVGAATRKAKYGVDVEPILETQQGKCAICNKGIGVSTLVVDHDHACCPGARSCGDCVRGLLCKKCNLGLGAFGDDTEALMNAARYLAEGN